jgi:hypothetical protein
MADEDTTPDSVELARRGLEAFNRRDLDAFMSFFAPDAVWDASRIGMGVAAIEGVAKIRRLLDDFYGRFDEVS